MPKAKKATIKKSAIKKTLKLKVHAKPEVIKEKIVVKEVPAETKGSDNGKEKYFQAIGRRKESIARIRLYTKKSTDSVEGEKALIAINNKAYSDYFSDISLRNIVEAPLRKLKSLNRFKVTVLVHGGGLKGQADAIKHGLARALIEFDINFRKKLKKSGFLTRDSRIKERRKYGLKKARKAPQWQKR